MWSRTAPSARAQVIVSFNSRTLSIPPRAVGSTHQKNSLATHSALSGCQKQSAPNMPVSVPARSTDTHTTPTGLSISRVIIAAIAAGSVGSKPPYGVCARKDAPRATRRSTSAVVASRIISPPSPSSSRRPIL